MKQEKANKMNGTIIQKASFKLNQITNHSQIRDLSRVKTSRTKISRTKISRIKNSRTKISRIKNSRVKISRAKEIWSRTASIVINLIYEEIARHTESNATFAKNTTTSKQLV